MRRSLLCCLSLLALLSLTGCQSLGSDPAAGLTGVPAAQAHYQAGDLERATELFLQLPALPAGQSDPAREALRKQLTDGWKRRGHQALKKHDLPGASLALSNIRALQPQAAVSLDALKRQLKGE